MNTANSPIIFGIQCMVKNAEMSGKHIKQLNFTSSGWENMLSLSSTHDFQDGFEKTCFGYPVNITEDIEGGMLEIAYYQKEKLN